MSTNDPTPSPAPTTITTTISQTTTDVERWRSLFYNTSLGLCIACPLIVALPPRKFDLYTFGLGITFFLSAGFVVEQRTGQGLLWHVGNHIPSVRNRERMEALKKEEEAWTRERGKVLREVKKKDGERGFWKRVWMGDESDDWVEERKRREREALEEGRGYGGLIVDHIKEVWGIKKDEDEEEEEGMEKVAKEKEAIDKKE